MKTNRTEDPEINSHSHLIFAEEAKNIHWTKKQPV
jgi:hypothetical protein